MTYLIKATFSDWKVVDKETYERFIQYLKDHGVNEKCIEKKTKVIE